MGKNRTGWEEVKGGWWGHEGDEGDWGDAGDGVDGGDRGEGVMRAKAGGEETET